MSKCQIDGCLGMETSSVEQRNTYIASLDKHRKLRACQDNTFSTPHH